MSAQIWKATWGGLPDHYVKGGGGGRGLNWGVFAARGVYPGVFGEGWTGVAQQCEGNANLTMP